MYDVMLCLRWLGIPHGAVEQMSRGADKVSGGT